MLVDSEFNFFYDDIISDLTSHIGWKKMSKKYVFERMAWKVFYYNTRLKLVISVLNWPKICWKKIRETRIITSFFVVFVSFCYNKEKKQHIVKSNNKYKNKTIIMLMIMKMMMIFASSLLNSRQFTCEVHFNKKSWNDSNIILFAY